ncbi:hypothetical protein ACFLUH_02850 [Chloroflexota bacterium]
MGKYNITFAQTYYILKDMGYIHWEGNLLFYNHLGDRLWMEDAHIKFTEPEQPPVSQYIDGDEIKCSFFTLVVNNRSLEEHYPGGLMAFIEKYYCRYNDDITTICMMSSDDLAGPYDDLISQGLIEEKDLYVFDANTGGDVSPPFDIPDMGWLKIRYEGAFGFGKSFVSLAA